MEGAVGDLRGIPFSVRFLLCAGQSHDAGRDGPFQADQATGSRPPTPRARNRLIR